MNVASAVSIGLLLLPWILLTVAILYATLKKPWQRERVLYAGLGFLTSVFIITIVPIQFVRGANGHAPWMESVVVTSIMNLFMMVPMGIVFTLIVCLSTFRKKLGEGLGTLF
ncbi:hypothetical protein [Geomicrobium sp. JCM 19038]|uniref:hypothetical protein n=1 Tax=Geomicrobium sp. JCM 19038 TaxID=1460635 RepID=UPI00045F0FEA|nr:hypothetical protein [Geomicrobium sp. JCM 19038]GAK08128.1 hypothetical protein JCM19038_1899 [Geomicrobium sp. JCM 19038]